MTSTATIGRSTDPSQTVMVWAWISLVPSHTKMGARWFSPAAESGGTRIRSCERDSCRVEAGQPAVIEDERFPRRQRHHIQVDRCRPVSVEQGKSVRGRGMVITDQEVLHRPLCRRTRRRHHRRRRRGRDRGVRPAGGDRPGSIVHPRSVDLDVGGGGCSDTEKIRCRCQ